MEPIARARVLLGLAIVLFSAGVGIVLDQAADRDRVYQLEIVATADRPGVLQLYFDEKGAYQEQRSSRYEVTAGGVEFVAKLPLAAGTYRQLRLDPPGGTLVIRAARITFADDRELCRLSLGDVRAGSQIERLELTDAGLAVHTAAAASDPQVEFVPRAPLVVHRPLRHVVLQERRGTVLAMLGVLAAVAWCATRPPVARGWRRWAGWAGGSPQAAIFGVAVVSVGLSSYPVIALGRSYVSPDGGTTLLYPRFPTLPGYTSDRLLDAKGSDVGAVMWQHVGYAAVQRRALQEFELPLWNRYNNAGSPLLGQGQSMFGDPLHFIPLLFGGEAWAWDVKYLAAKVLFAAGTGVAVWWLTRSLVAALLAAAVSPFIGFFVHRINHPAFFGVCYSPWLLVGWQRFLSAASRRDYWMGAAILLGANWAVLFSGTVKEAFVLLLSVNLAGAALVFGSDLAPGKKALRLAGAVGLLLLLALVTLPAWGTFFDTLRRAYTSYASARVAYQIQPALLAGFFDEIFYRVLTARGVVFNPALNAVFGVGGAYFLVSFAAQRPGVRALALASLLPFAAAFGFIPPDWLTRLPFVAHLWHVDNCFSSVLVVLWAVVGGAGLAQVLEDAGTAAGWRRLLGTAAVLAGGVLVWRAFQDVVHRPVDADTFSVHALGGGLRVSGFVAGYVWALVVATGLLLACLARPACFPGAPMRGFMVALCLVTLTWRHGLHAAGIGSDDYVVHPGPRAAFTAESPVVRRLQAGQAVEPRRTIGVDGALQPGWTAMYGLPSLPSFDALLSPHFRDLLREVQRTEWVRPFVAADLPANARMLDALNVGYYVAGPEATVPEGGDRTLRERLDLALYESPRAWPGAFFTDRCGTHEDAAGFVRAVQDGDGRAFAMVQAGDASAVEATRRLRAADAAARVVQPARAYRFTENSTRFRIAVPGPGLVVLLENFWPGDWQCEVQGRTARVVRVNHAFCGVVVEEAGDLEIVFRYRPNRFSLYLALSAAGMAGFAAVGLAAVRAPRCAPATGVGPAATKARKELTATRGR